MAAAVRMRPEDFDIGSVIAKGAFGSIFKAIRKSDGRVFALKQVPLSDMSKVEREETIDEARMLSQLVHPHITRHYDSFIDRENKLNIFMEFASKGNLATFIKSCPDKRVPEDAAWKIFIQAMLGLNHIHSKKIIHRDIKSLNIFIDAYDNIKIGDLGIARALSNSSNFARSIVGTPLYLSPEVVSEKPYNEKSDVWALGVVLYECCMGKYPFEAQNEGALYRKILRGQFPPLTGPYSAAMVQMVNLCLTFKPEARPDTGSILRHPVVQAKAKALGIDMSPRGAAEDRPVFEAPRQPPPPQPLQYVQPVPGAPPPGHPDQQYAPQAQYGQMNTGGPYIDPLYGQLRERTPPPVMGGQAHASTSSPAAGRGGGYGQSPQAQQQRQPQQQQQQQNGQQQRQPQYAPQQQQYGSPGGYGQRPPSGQPQRANPAENHPFNPPPGIGQNYDAMVAEISQIRRQQEAAYQQQMARPPAGGPPHPPAARAEVAHIDLAHPFSEQAPNVRMRPEELQAAGGRKSRPNSGAPFALHHGPEVNAGIAAVTYDRQEQEARTWAAPPSAPQFARRRAPDLQITGPSLRGGAVTSTNAYRSAPRAADDSTSYVSSSHATSYYR